MSKPTHTIRLRDGQAAAEAVTAEQLAQVETHIVGFADAYEVLPIEHPEKPAALAKEPVAEKSK